MSDNTNKKRRRSQNSCDSHAGREDDVRTETAAPRRAKRRLNPELEMIDKVDIKGVRDSTGRLVAFGAASSPTRSGQDERIIGHTSFHPSGIQMSTSHLEDLRRAGEIVQMSSGVKQLAVFIVPVDTEKWKQSSTSAHAVETLGFAPASLTTPRTRRGPSSQMVDAGRPPTRPVSPDLRPWQHRHVLLVNSIQDMSARVQIEEVENEEEEEEEEDEEEEGCCVCESKTHLVSCCATPGTDGLIHACPVCNVKEHNFDKCSKFQALPKELQFRYLVRWRRNMPAFAVRTSTNAYLSCPHPIPLNGRSSSYATPESPWPTNSTGKKSEGGIVADGWWVKSNSTWNTRELPTTCELEGDRESTYQRASKQGGMTEEAAENESEERRQ